jgi:hypothetical protein
MYIAKDGYSYNEGCPLLKLGGKTPAIRLGLTACTTRHRSPRRSWVVEEVSLGRKRGASHHSPIGAHLGRRAQLGRMGRKWGAWGEIGARGANGAHGRKWGAWAPLGRTRSHSRLFHGHSHESCCGLPPSCGALRWRRQCLGCLPGHLRLQEAGIPRVGLASYVHATGALLHKERP